MVAKPDIHRYQIRRIVAAIHVGKSDEYVRVQLRERTTGLNWRETVIARAERFAVKCHRQNQKLYSAVRTGRL